jgi:NTP pyrophosphatase (non-canonical NTP hydrolase)
MDIKKLQEQIKEFCKDRDWDQFHTPKNIAASISIEASELLQLFQWAQGAKWSELQDKELKKEVEEELADVLIYLLRFSDLSGIDIEKVIEEKLIKNENKYPISKSKGSDKK